MEIGKQTFFRIAVAPLLVLLTLFVLPLGAARPAKSSASSPQSDAQQIGDSHLGFVWVNGPGYTNPSLRYQQAVSAGAHWTRWPIYWNEVEATQGQLDYTRQDAVVNGDVANGLQVNGILVGTPSWVATAGLSSVSLPLLGQRTFPADRAISALTASSAASVPKNLFDPVFDAYGRINTSNYWAYFVYQTVCHYRDKVKVWEMWNEPDFTNVFWSGGDQNYARLLKVGYQAAKAADPSVTVLFGGLQYWSDQGFFPRILSLIAQDPEARSNNYFFDAVPYHPYTSPNLIPQFVSQARSQMLAAGIPVKPVWINETNVPVCDDTAGHSCTENNSLMGTMEQQAAFSVQAIALATAMGVEKTFLFQLYDDGLSWPDVYGMIRNNGTPRPAYQAYQAAATYLANPSASTRRDLGNAEIIGLNSAGIGKVTVAWSKVRTSVPVSIAPVDTTAELRDKYGRFITTLQPSGGCYRLTLPAATDPYPPDSTVAFVGGDPYLLIERGAFAQALGGSESSATPTYAAGSPLTGATASTALGLRIIFPFVPVGLTTGCQ